MGRLQECGKAQSPSCWHLVSSICTSVSRGLSNALCVGLNVLLVFIPVSVCVAGCFAGMTALKLSHYSGHYISRLRARRILLFSFVSSLLATSSSHCSSLCTVSFLAIIPLAKVHHLFASGPCSPFNCIYQAPRLCHGRTIDARWTNISRSPQRNPCMFPSLSSLAPLPQRLITSCRETRKPRFHLLTS